MLPLLATYGLTVNADLVGDNASYNPVAQKRQIFTERMRYPLWVKVITDNINKKHPIMEDFTTINMFWASSITLLIESRRHEILL